MTFQCIDQRIKKYVKVYGFLSFTRILSEKYQKDLKLVFRIIRYCFIRSFGNLFQDYKIRYCHENRKNLIKLLIKVA